MGQRTYQQHGSGFSDRVLVSVSPMEIDMTLNLGWSLTNDNFSKVYRTVNQVTVSLKVLRDRALAVGDSPTTLPERFRPSVDTHVFVNAADDANNTGIAHLIVYANGVITLVWILWSDGISHSGRYLDGTFSFVSDYNPFEKV